MCFWDPAASGWWGLPLCPCWAPARPGPSFPLKAGMLVSPWHVLDRRHSQIFREQLLPNQRDKRGQVVGRGGRAGRNKESGEQSRRVQHKPSQPKTELSQNRRDKQTQGRRKGKGCKTKKQDLFQFLKDTMKTNPREARSDYCALSWLTRNVEYPVFFQTSAVPSTFKGKGV